MINNAMFVLAVPDLKISSAFYREVLGFEIREIGDPGWLIYEDKNCQIMAGECPDAIPPKDLGDHSYFCYLNVADVDKLFEHVSKTSTEILKPVRDEPWGMREFAIRTIDGHRIMIGQNISKN